MVLKAGNKGLRSDLDKPILRRQLLSDSPFNLPAKSNATKSPWTAPRSSFNSSMVANIWRISWSLASSSPSVTPDLLFQFKADVVFGSTFGSLRSER